MQDDRGWKAIFGLPKVYRAFQDLAGADYAKSWFIRECIRPKPMNKLVDIGCGPGDILEQLREVDYIGIDISGRYIAEARKRYGRRALFLQGTTEDYRWDERVRNADLATCIGLLHHLEDKEARQVISFARENLKPGGRFVSIEPCFLVRQTAISTWMMAQDRGQNIRFEGEWKALLRSEFANSSTAVVTGLLRLPYIHVILEGTK